MPAACGWIPRGDSVLGRPDEHGKRAGRLFAENGMRICDVEILDVKIGDETIEKLLTETQHAVVSQTLELEAGRKAPVNLHSQRDSSAGSWRGGEESVRVGDERLDIGSVANHAAPPD